MEMFNKKATKERIGDIKKNASLNHLKEVEKYFFAQIKKYKIETSYDVIANELPYFKTLNYTEWAHCFIMHPLQQELRLKQMSDAYAENSEIKLDYTQYFKDRILNKNSNKYEHIDMDTVYKSRDVLVVLVGSNKLKERICLNKLRWINDKYEEDVWFKPHPLTTYQLVGELKDLFGDESVTDRDADMYSLLVDSNIVYTSHMSESVVYAVSLDKQIEPIDVYGKVEQASFYHINRNLFLDKNPKLWINTVLNSAKSGIINPELDSQWKQRLNDYLDYIMQEREEHKDKYVYSTK